MKKMQGLDSLNRRFRAMIPAARRAFQMTLAEGAEEITAEMKRMAPVDTGAVRDSIRWQLDNSGEDAKSKSGLRLHIIAGGRNAPHAIFVEFGTTAMPAHPFFFPAYRLLRTRVRRRIGRVVGKAVRDSFMKGN